MNNKQNQKTMNTYELRTPDGRRLKVEAKSRGNAVKQGEKISGVRVEIVDNVKIKK